MINEAEFKPCRFYTGRQLLY